MRTGRFERKNQLLNIIPILISALAVILSQFPPVYTWFERPEIKSSDIERINILDNFGKATLEVPITLVNKGQKNGSISKITLTIFSETREVIGVFECQSTTENKDVPFYDFTNQPVNFQQIIVTTQSPWSRKCYFPLFDSEDSDIQQLIADITQDKRNSFQRYYDEKYGLLFPTVDDVPVEVATDFESSYKIKPEYRKRLSEILSAEYRWIENKPEYIGISIVDDNNGPVEYPKVYQIETALSQDEFLSYLTNSYRFFSDIDIRKEVKRIKVKITSDMDLAKKLSFN